MAEKITFEKAVITTHFPFINNHGGYFVKLYQHRSYVIALENADDVHGMFVDENDKGLSFRNYENLLLLGGGGHRTGKKGGNWKILEKSEAGSPVGTKITVENLFYNTPARLKHMKSLYTELANITEYVNKIALSHPEIKFTLINNDNQ